MKTFKNATALQTESDHIDEMATLGNFITEQMDFGSLTAGQPLMSIPSSIGVKALKALKLSLFKLYAF